MYIKSGTSTWKNTAALYIKSGASVWSRVRQGYIKTSSTLWKRFFYEANLPTVNTKPSIRTTNTGAGTIYDGPLATSPQFLDEDLYGKDGSYNNYTSITGRKFSWADTADSATRTTVVFDDRFNADGGITAATRLSLDEDYLFYEIQVNNGTGDDFINPVSNAIKLIKKEPALGPFATSLTGSASPNSTLTFNYNLENYYYNRVEQANSKIRWWRSSTQSASGTLLKEETISDTVTSSDSSSLSGQSTYTISASADNDSYIVVEIVAASSWTRHFGYSNEYQIASFATAKVQAPYRFSFGKTLYVGTNGYLGLDAGAYSAAGLPFGRSISVYVKDLVQYYLAEYSDSNVYYLYIKSYLYNTSAASSNALDYQIKFYNDPNINYCDVYIVRKGANLGSTSDIAPGYYGAYGEVQNQYAGFQGPYFIGQGTVFRVYFGGTAATTQNIPWTPVSDALWEVQPFASYPPGLDDDFTAIVTAANQQAQAPTNSSVPTLSTDTGNFSAGSTISVNTGTWSGAASYTYELLYSTSDPVSTTAATKTLVNTNQYVITLGDAVAASYYFRPKITAWSGANQTGLSTIAYGATSARSTIIPTTSISVGSATTTGFTISGTAGPIVSSISTTYVAIDEIYIYNSSQQLISTITTGLPVVSSSDGTWSYTWPGGSASTTYYARVRVRSTDSDQTKFTTGFSNAISTSAAVTTPTSLSASTTDSTKIALSWSGGSADTYLFYWTTGNAFRPDNTSTFADFTTTNTSNYDWTGMSRGTTYYFFIRSRRGTNPNFTYSPAWFPGSAPGVTGKAPLYAPNGVNSLGATAQSTSRIDLSWSAPTVTALADSATGYDIYFSTSASTPGSFATPSASTSSTSYSVTGLSSNTTYYFWVRATNADNTGSKAGPWAFASATTLAAANPRVTTIRMTNGGGSTASPNSPRMSIQVTTAEAASFQYTIYTSSTLPIGSTQAGSGTINTTGVATVSTNSGAFNNYYEVYVTPWSGSNGTGTQGTTRYAGTKRNTTTSTTTSYSF